MILLDIKILGSPFESHVNSLFIEVIYFLEIKVSQKVLRKSPPGFFTRTVYFTGPRTKKARHCVLIFVLMDLRRLEHYMFSTGCHDSS